MLLPSPPSPHEEGGGGDTDSVKAAQAWTPLLFVDGAIPGLTPADTVKRVSAGIVTETIPREELVTVQTPQAFRAEALRKAHASGLDATDDAALLEAIGATVQVVAGEATNTKLTAPEDLERAAAFLVESR